MSTMIKCVCILLAAMVMSALAFPSFKSNMVNFQRRSFPDVPRVPKPGLCARNSLIYNFCYLCGRETMHMVVYERCCLNDKQIKDFCERYLQ